MLVQLEMTGRLIIPPAPKDFIDDGRIHGASHGSGNSGRFTRMRTYLGRNLKAFLTYRMATKKS